MKKHCLAVCIAVSIWACGNKSNTASNVSSANVLESTQTIPEASQPNNNGYTAVQSGEAQNLIGKKVVFEGTRAGNDIGQHMRSTGPSSRERSNFYINPDAVTGMGQMVVYYTDGMLPENGMMEQQRLRLFGTLKSISGPGKGGGEHTEIFLELDKLELL